MKKFIAVFCLIVVLTPALAFAQNPCLPGDAGSEATDRLGACVSQVYLWSLGAAGILAILMLIIGGYYVMTARGNAQQASQGKSFLYSSILGIIILLGAYLILSTINPDLTDFRINSLDCLDTGTPRAHCPPLESPGT